MILLTDGLSGPEGQWTALLSLREQEEGRARTSPSARRNWLLGRLAAKAAAGTMLGLAPDKVEVLRGDEGPPRLSRLNGPAEKLFVSISHTEGGALAAASFKPVGVDLETKDRLFSDRAWTWAFNEEEQSWAGARSDNGERLAMWCAKEAAAKSWGLPLLNHLAEVRISGADWAARRLRVERLGGGSVSALVELLEAENFLLALAFAQ